MESTTLCHPNVDECNVFSHTLHVLWGKVFSLGHTFLISESALTSEWMIFLVYFKIPLMISFDEADSIALA